jgi:MFS family permease
MSPNPENEHVDHELSSKQDMEAATIADPQLEDASTIVIPDRQLEKKVVQKLDLRLAPMFAVLYFIAYLDRSNIGNAAIVGLTEDLKLTGAQFSTAVSVFFATYVAFEIPVVLAMKKLKPSRAITMMVIGWSTITIGTAFVKNYRELVAVRLLLGLCEAGFFPSLSLYITMVYKREEQVCEFPSTTSDGRLTVYRVAGWRTSSDLLP